MMAWGLLTKAHSTDIGDEEQASPLNAKSVELEASSTAIGAISSL
jgi:hypothetical protein